MDIHRGVAVAKLPLTSDPAIKVSPNKERALTVFKSQVKKLQKNDCDKEDVIASELKLQFRGHVEYVKNLTIEQQNVLKSHPIQNFIPWRVVWKENSVTTPCRVVFDASMPTASKYSLNDILAKGRNNLNKLVEIFIRWTSHKYAFHSDVEKMYNSVLLNEEHWCLQRYVWQKDLNPDAIPEEKIIKTLIYGVKSSGNQSEYALRETANLLKDDYPEVHNLVQNDIYVDDCISGCDSITSCHQLADELTLVLRRGGFNLKGFTFSGQTPSKELSNNQDYINIAGLK